MVLKKKLSVDLFSNNLALRKMAIAFFMNRSDHRTVLNP